jgi:hypothetical protein
MNRLPGIAGTLFPSHYLADAIEHDAPTVPAARLASRRRHVSRWWEGVSATCGPATGLRALFDLVAMPLFGMLGFRAHDAAFDRRHATAWLSTRQGTPVGLVLLPWAERPSTLWRDLTWTARHIGADWAFLLAPPFLSLIDARGHATRRDVEFTLPDVFETPSFARFWWLARADAFDPAAGSAGHATSWIDDLVERAAGFQDRVREDLQHGVAEALSALSRAIAAAHRRGPLSRRSGDVASAAVLPITSFDEALTIVYRILFLLFAESRELVPVRAPIYAGAYAIGALSRDARADAAVPGLWDALAAVTRLSRVGCRTHDLIVRPFNGRLFSRASAPSLEMARRRGRPSAAASALDAAARRALLALASRTGPGGREEINYADLGVEQLGSVYERVLDLDVSPPGSTHAVAPHAPQAPRVHLRHSARRKQTGTFYTPRALAEFVVRRTLAPLVAGAPADAILKLRIVDPAMGSGAFLVAACRFLASAYERALIDEGRLAPADLDEHERADIRRRIAEQCLAGVDLNPVAVQLARLSLWLATLADGKPLSFLDHRLRVGNSLVGASPADLDRTTGRRGSGASATLPLFDDRLLEHSIRRAALPLLAIASRRDEHVTDVRAKEVLWNQLMADHSPLHAWRLAATLWCARWFWPGGDVAPGPAELRALLAAVLRADRTLPASRVASRVTVAGETGRRHAFFHWPLEFPDVFYDPEGQTLGTPGFDAIIGNPPWEMLRHGPDEPGRDAEDRAGLVHFVRESGLFPSCTRGHLNLYQPFLDRSLALARQGGRVGLVLPWGLAADDGAVLLRERLLDRSAVDTLVGLDNVGGLFPIHRGLRFLLLTTTAGTGTHEIRGRFGVKTAAELDALPGRMDGSDENPFPIRLTPRVIRTVGGSAARFPDVRRVDDLQFLERVSTRFPPLGRADGWAVSFGRELNATEHRGHFGRHGLPVIEGRHLSPFRTDAGAATAFVDRACAERLFPDARFDQPRLGYRDVSGVGNRLSLIAAMVPAGTLTTHTVFCLRSRTPLATQHFLCGLFNSYVLNAVVRMLMGGHLTTTLVEGLPVPVWTADARQRRIARLSARLARHPDSVRGTALLHAEVAHLYGLDSQDFDRILAGFPLVPDADRERAARLFRTAGPTFTSARTPPI